MFLEYMRKKAIFANEMLAADSAYARIKPKTKSKQRKNKDKIIKNEQK